MKVVRKPTTPVPVIYDLLSLTEEEAQYIMDFVATRPSNTPAWPIYNALHDAGFRPGEKVIA